jgi:hypothetical protein
MYSVPLFLPPCFNQFNTGDIHSFWNADSGRTLCRADPQPDLYPVSVIPLHFWEGCRPAYTGNNQGGLVQLVLTSVLLVVFILFGMQVREGLFVEPILNQTCTQSRSILSTFGRDAGQYIQETTKWTAFLNGNDKGKHNHAESLFGFEIVRRYDATKSR